VQFQLAIANNRPFPLLDTPEKPQQFWQRPHSDHRHSFYISKEYARRFPVNPSGKSPSVHTSRDPLSRPDRSSTVFVLDCAFRQVTEDRVYRRTLLGLTAVIAIGQIACPSKGAPTAQRAAEGKKMTTEPTHLHHAIDYIEISVTDMTQAKAFYATAFGWAFNDYGPDYAGIKKQNGEAGGLRREEKVQAGGPLVILFSNDLEVSLGNVNAAGGTITKEPFDFPGGRRFQFKDPSGNELAVWSKK